MRIGKYDKDKTMPLKIMLNSAEDQRAVLSRISDMRRSKIQNWMKSSLCRTCPKRIVSAEKNFALNLPEEGMQVKKTLLSATGRLQRSPLVHKARTHSPPIPHRSKCNNNDSRPLLDKFLPDSKYALTPCAFTHGSKSINTSYASA